jgi:hypothetical protein
MATAVAAAYMNIPLAHTMGGEISGTIDESIRHAVTKLSHVHLPANTRAPNASSGMGEDPAWCIAVGVRASIWCRRFARATGISNRRTGSSGRRRRAHHARQAVPARQPASRDEPSTATGEEQIVETLMALHELQMPTIMLWPNADAGSEDISRGMRKFREKYRPEYIRFYKNFPIDTYVRLMLSCACASAIRGAAARRRASSACRRSTSARASRDAIARTTSIDAATTARAIVAAVIQKQLRARRYPSNHLYGDGGGAGARSRRILVESPLRVQKRLSY